MATSYHFDLGNSNTGPVGVCCRVLADSPVEAVAKLREAFDKVLDHPTDEAICVFDDITDDPALAPVPGVEYIRIYLNPEYVSVTSIDDYEERTA